MLERGFAIIDTTLREGEQHGLVDFSTDDKVEIARALASFGVEFIEVTSPRASPRSRDDCARLAGLELGCTEVIAHVRCDREDIRIALDTGVRHISLVMAVSPQLRAAGHGMSIGEMTEHALAVVGELRRQAPEVRVRFSTEDTFRAPVEDVLALYRALAGSGLVHRLGVADTTGFATPEQVTGFVRRLTGSWPLEIEFHGHDDTGCAIANAHAALRAGATHINTSVLGLGERNGIASLEGFIARLYADDPEAIRERFDLPALPKLAALLSAKTGLPIPFNQPIVGQFAFTHKAGMHTKAVLNDPASYEILVPEDFGRSRDVLINHKLTGWNAVRARARQLAIELPDAAIKAVTQRIKELADREAVNLDQIDRLLRDAAQRAGGPGG